jgi:dephospho-CoA kinase
MSDVKKIAFIGQQCAGKTTAALVAQPDTDNHSKFAKPLYAVNNALSVPKNRAFMQQVADLVKECFGQEFFIDAFDELLWWYNNDKLIVNDDCRLQLEFNYLKSYGWQTVYIDASEEIRRQRAKALGLEFIADHNSETEVPSLKSQCDLVIVNEGTLEEFEEKVRWLV